jgi:regulator of sigma E protease
VSLSWVHLLAFVLAVCVLVTVHEFGHYWVARRLGFKVLRFSVGFGRPLLKRVAGRDRTEYVLAAVPLGGYVKLLDEREGPVPSDELARSFTRRPHWQRIAVLLAGPAANFIFAIIVLAGTLLVSGRTEVRPVLGAVTPESRAAQAGVRSGEEVISVNGQPAISQRDVWIGLLEGVTRAGPLSLGLRDAAGGERVVAIDTGDAAARRALSEPSAAMVGLGLRFQEPPIPALLGLVEPGGPAARAGLQNGDEILSVNAEPVHDFLGIVALVRAHPDENITVRYRRGGSEAVARVAVAGVEQDGARIGRIQVRQPRAVPYPPGMLRHVSLGPLAALGGAASEAWNMTALQARLLTRMLAGEVSVKNLSGPLTIAELAGDSAVAGFAVFLNFLVMVSLALGFMNLLPIPILDGGQVVIQAIEWLKGSPLSERAQAAGQQVGIALVVLLLGIALFNDISRQFG